MYDEIFCSADYDDEFAAENAKYAGINEDNAASALRSAKEAYQFARRAYRAACIAHEGANSAYMAIVSD